MTTTMPDWLYVLSRWTIFMIWGMGLIVTALLVWLALNWAAGRAVDIGFTRWRQVRIWGYLQAALWAYRRAGHRPPLALSFKEPEEVCRAMALELIKYAKKTGHVVTIETVPMEPLAMGNYYMRNDVRKARGEDAQ